MVYEEELERKVKSIEDIDVENIPVISLLKDEGVPYEIEIREKIDYERFNEWDSRYNKYLVIYVANEHIEKLKNVFPEEFLFIKPKFSELPEEEQKRINDVESELCIEDDFADANFERAMENWNGIINENKKTFKAIFKIIMILILGIIIGIAFIMAQQITIGIYVMFFTLIPCLIIEMSEKRRTNRGLANRETTLKEAYAALVKPAKYMTATVNEDFFKGTVFEEIYANTPIETANKLSLNENGQCYVATDVEAWLDSVFQEEPIKILDGICIKTKTNKYVDEPMLIDISAEYNQKTKEEKLKIETLCNGYLIGNEMISSEFEKRAKELDKKYGVAVSMYYIGNVAYIMIDAYNLSFQTLGGKYSRDLEALKEEAQVINEYVELAKML